MKKSWEVKKYEIISMRVEFEEYNQLLEEMAELVYVYLCQLPEKESLAPETSTALAVGRTGTDG